jgi:acyl-[acyl carrier protein]--UDP-N-acetylglucosamine O-acyltransferase
MIGHSQELGDYSKINHAAQVSLCVPPGGLVASEGRICILKGTNIEGLVRQGIAPDVREELRMLYVRLFRRHVAPEDINCESLSPLGKTFIDFAKRNKGRMVSARSRNKAWRGNHDSSNYG